MKQKTNKIIGLTLLSVWGVLILFFVISLIKPDWLQKLSDPGKKVEAITLIDAGDHFLKSKNYPMAAGQYTAALKIIPDFKRAIANLALVHQLIGNNKKSISLYEHLLSLDLEYPEVIYYNLGDIYEKTNQLDIALDNYLLAAKNAPFPEKSYQKAGKIFMDNKEWANAIVNFELAIDNRKNIENTFKGALLRSKKTLSDTSKVYNYINEQLQTGSYLKKLNVYDQSIFDKELKKDINLAKTYYNIGYCHAMLNGYKDASYYFEKAIKINPSFRKSVNDLKANSNFQ